MKLLGSFALLCLLQTANAFSAPNPQGPREFRSDATLTNSQVQTYSNINSPMPAARTPSGQMVPRATAASSRSSVPPPPPPPPTASSSSGSMMDYQEQWKQRNRSDNNDNGSAPTTSSPATTSCTTSSKASVTASPYSALSPDTSSFGTNVSSETNDNNTPRRKEGHRVDVTPNFNERYAQTQSHRHRRYEQRPTYSRSVHCAEEMWNGPQNSHIPMYPSNDPNVRIY